LPKSRAPNERPLYYSFGSKELLYVAVLESMYAFHAKKESELDLTGLEPREAMAALATSIWAHLWENPEWLGLINSENLHHLPVEWIEINEAAIAAELLDMLAMGLRVTAKDVETCRADERLIRGALDRQGRGRDLSVAHSPFQARSVV